MDFRVDFAGAVPLYMTGYMTYNHKDYFKNSIYFFEDNDPSFLVQNEYFMDFNWGLPASSNGKFVNGYDYGYTKDVYYQTNNFSRTDTADKTYFDFFSGYLCFETNTLNRKQYANQGFRLKLLCRYISGEEKTVSGSTSEFPGEEFIASHDWFQFSVLYDKYFNKMGFLTLGLFGEVLISNQPDFNNYVATILRTPVFDPVPEMKTLFLPNYRAKNYGALGLKTISKIYKQLDLRIDGYLFQPYEELQKAEDGSTETKKALSNRSWLASASFVYNSPIGPVSLAFNYYDRAEDNFSVMFNIGYIIFNGSAID